MSEKEKLEYKDRLKKLEIKKLDKLESLAVKVSILSGILLLLTSLIVTLLIS